MIYIWIYDKYINKYKYLLEFFIIHVSDLHCIHLSCVSASVTRHNSEESTMYKKIVQILFCFYLILMKVEECLLKSTV